MRALEGTFWFVNLCGDLLIALAVVVLVEQARQDDRERPWPRGGSGVLAERGTADPGAALSTGLDSEFSAMDKKLKKKLDVLNQRLQKLRQQLAGAKKQMDEPEEVQRLETEIRKAEADVGRLKEPS